MHIVYKPDHSLNTLNMNGIDFYENVCHFQSIDWDNDFTNTKYCILMMMHADMDKEEGPKTQESKSMEEIW